MKDILKCYDTITKMDYESFLGALLLMQENEFFEYFEAREKEDTVKMKEIENKLLNTAHKWADSEVRLIPEEVMYIVGEEEEDLG